VLVNKLVPRLEYYNYNYLLIKAGAVYMYVLNEIEICLARVLRSAARLVGKIPKYDHVTRYIMLDALRWLPVRQRIE